MEHNSTTKQLLKKNKKSDQRKLKTLTFSDVSAPKIFFILDEKH